MTKPYTINEVISNLPSPRCDEIPRPNYIHLEQTSKGPKVGCAVESMKHHMTDEGWEIFKGLEEAGYALTGHDVTRLCTTPSMTMNLTNLSEIITALQPSTIVLQDPREWMGLTADRSRDPRMQFTNLGSLAKRPDIYKSVILKDCQSNRDLNIQTCLEAGINSWIVYYNERIVKHVAPYVRPSDMIRTYHTIDSTRLPEWWKRMLYSYKFSKNHSYDHDQFREFIGLHRLSDLNPDKKEYENDETILYPSERNKGCLLSGAISDAYPLRKRLVNHSWALPYCTVMRHPGYHRRGCNTPEYLNTLCKYKVSICTSSKYGYLLRKIIESVACGCVVITDLPEDEVVPEIDGQLVRVRPDTSTQEIASLVAFSINTYDHETQARLALKAINRFDYRIECRRLANEVENHKLSLMRSK